MMCSFEPMSRIREGDQKILFARFYNMFNPTKWDTGLLICKTFLNVARRLRKTGKIPSFGCVVKHLVSKEMFCCYSCCITETTAKAITTYTAANESKNQFFLAVAILRFGQIWNGFLVVI